MSYSHTFQPTEADIAKKKALNALVDFYNVDENNIQLKVLAGGNSGNPVYLATVSKDGNEQKVVARVSSLTDRAKSEFLISKIMGDTDVSPKIYYPDMLTPDHTVVLSEFIEGYELRARDARDHEKAMLKHIKAIHSMPLEYQGQRFAASHNLFGGIRKFANDLDIPDKEKYLQEISRLEELLKIDGVTQPAFVHNDINLNNCKFDGKRVAIFDWGDGGIGDPLEDLAHYSNLFGYNEQQSQALLEKYLGHEPGKAELAHFNICKNISALRIGFAVALYACKGQENNSFTPSNDAGGQTFLQWYESTYKPQGQQALKTAEGLRTLANAGFTTWRNNQSKIQEWQKTLEQGMKQRATK